MRAALILVLAVAAGCNDNAPSGEPNGPVGAIANGRVASSRANRNTAGGEAKAIAAGELPPPGPLPRFVGNWAADEESCQSAAWRFTATGLNTPAGSKCSFDRVTQVPGGYDVQATCAADGPPKADTIEIRFAESAKAMLFQSKVIAGNGLLFCGRGV